MIINTANLRTLHTAFLASFQGAFDATSTQWQEIATPVPSSTSENEYGWIGELPEMREWIGDRVIHGIRQHGYTLRNKEFELTVGVKRPKIEDDQFGIYTPLFAQLGQSARRKPDALVFGALQAGETELCYDGKPFFAADHPVLDAKGKTVNVSNTAGGIGTPWYLIDASQVIKPMIFQERKKAEFVAKTKIDDEDVFKRNEYIWGADARWNAGYGFWQMAYLSKQPLTAENFEAAWVAMTAFKRDGGSPLGVKPTHIVVPTSLEIQAEKVLKAALDPATGGTNILAGKVQIMPARYL